MSLVPSLRHVDEERHMLAERVQALEAALNQCQAQQVISARFYATFRALFDQTTDGIFLFTVEGVCTMVNRRGAEMLGYSEAELVGKTVAVAMTAEEAQKADQIRQRLLAGENIPLYERIFQRKDGTSFPAEVNLTLVRDDDGQPSHLQSLVRDITARKEAQNALTEQHNLLQTLIESIPDNVFVKDRESRFILNNAAHARRRNRTPGTMVGLSDFDLFPRDFASEYFADEQEVMRTGVPILNKEERTVGIDGSPRWMLTSKIPLRDRNGEIVGIVGVTRDITDLKAREAEHQESERFIREIASTIPDMLYVYDRAEHRYVYMNASTISSISGYSFEMLEQFSGDVVTDLVHPDDIAAFKGRMVRLETLSDDGMVETVYRMRHANGDWRWLYSRDRVFTRDEDGRPRRIFGVVQDISEQRRVEQKLVKQNEYLRALSEIAPALMNRLDPSELLTVVLARTAALIGSQGAFIDLVDSERGQLVEFAKLGHFANFSFRTGKGEGLGGLVWKRGEMIVLDDYATWEHRLQLDGMDKIHACAALPLRSGQEIIGVMCLGFTEPGRKFTDDELALVNRVAELTSIALDNTRLYSAAQQELAERKRAEAALRASEERYRAVVHEQSELIARFLPDTTLSFVNDAYCRYFGKSADELIGQSFLWLVPEEKHADIFAYMKTLTLEQPVRVAEHPAKLPTGEIRWLQWSDRAIFDADGQIVEYQTSARDVTERKLAEEALRLSEARYRAVVEVQSELICRYQPDKIVTFVNDAYCRYFGITREAIVGRPFVKWVVEEDRQRIEALISQLDPRGQQTVTYEQRVVLDGQLRWQQWTDTVIAGDDGRIREYQSVGRDITERKEAEEALQKERNLLRTLIDTLPEHIYVKDRESRFLLANPPCVHSVGVESLQDILGKTDFDLMTDQAMARRFYEMEQEIMRTGVPVEFEEAFTDTDGGTQWKYQIKIPFRSPQGEIIGLVGINRDITDIKLAGAALSESEQRFRQMAENINQAFWLIDPSDNHPLYVSPAFERIWGRQVSEIEGSHDFFLETLLPSDVPVLLESLETMQDGLFNIEYRIVRPDGSIRWVASRAFPVMNAEGLAYRIAGVSEDITERKLAEHALQNERDFVSAIVNNAVALIAVTDREGCFVRFNRACETVSGYSAEEIIGRSLWDTFILPEEREQVEAALRPIYEGKYPMKNVNHWRLRDGSKRLIEWSNTALVDSEGSVTHIISTGIDITARKQLEERSIELAIEREKVKIIGNFVRDASHDFRTPLSILNTNLYLLRRLPEDNDRERRIKEMEQQVYHLRDLLDQLMTMTRLDSAAEQKLRMVNVNELLRDIEITMQTVIAKQGLSFVLNLDPTLPHIQADSIQLSQALSNVIGNALAYTPRGGQVTVQTCLQEGYVTIRVHDTGVGIAPEDLPHIFERFYRADKARTSSGVAGAGLGLAIARKVVEMHWGRIEAQSKPGEGSLFTILLPLITR